MGFFLRHTLTRRPTSGTSIVIDPGGGGEDPEDPPVFPPGTFEYLRPLLRTGFMVTLPQENDYGPGMHFDNSIGDYTGSAVDHSFPEPYYTYDMGDLGDLEQNTNALNNRINLIVSNQLVSGHCRITLPPLSHFGIYTKRLKTNNTGHKLQITTSSFASLPPESPGTSFGSKANRVRPSQHENLMPIFSCLGTGDFVVNCEDGAKGYHLRGINFLGLADTYKDAAAMIKFTPDEDDVADWARQPQDMHVSQCLFNGDINSVGNKDNTPKRAVIAAGYGISVTDCYMTRIGRQGSDPHLVNFRWGRGAFKLHNCYGDLSGGGECWMVGGTDLPQAGSNPSDASNLPHNIEITGNHFVAAQYAGNLIPKNLGELKFGCEVLIANNYLYSPVITGHGCLMWMKVTTQNGYSTAADTKNVTIANNFGPSGATLLTVTGAESMVGGYFGLMQTNRIVIVNNLGIASDTGVACITVQSSECDDISILHNTAYVKQDGNPYIPALGFTDRAGTSGSRKGKRFDVRFNNLIGTQDSNVNTIKVLGGDHNAEIGQTGFNNVVEDSIMELNLTPTNNSNYSNQVQAGDKNGMKMVNPSGPGGDFSLASDSPGKGAGNLGSDLGYSKTVMDIIMARVIET